MPTAQQYQFDRAKRGITFFGLYLSITAKVRAGNEETLSIRLVEIKRLCSVTAQKIRNVPQLYTTLLQFEDIEIGHSQPHMVATLSLIFKFRWSLSTNLL